MKKDMAIEEIRKVRSRISASFGHDTKALMEHYRQQECMYADRMMPMESTPVKSGAVTKTVRKNSTRGKSSKRCA